MSGSPVATRIQSQLRTKVNQMVLVAKSEISSDPQVAASQPLEPANSCDTLAIVSLHNNFQSNAVC